MWVRPGEYDLTPSYQQAEVTPATGELVPIASGLPKHATTTAITVNQPRAGLSVARLAPGDTLQLPQAPQAHLFVATGNVTVEAIGDLGPADAARIHQADGQHLTAGPAGAELLLWEMTD
jgi:redox-sensitive bicupin YhaK (pirin superfamily)